MEQIALEWEEPAEGYYYDEDRLRGKRGELFALLQDGKWHTNGELANAGGLSYAVSLSRFRDAGWLIECRHVKGGIWKYRLEGKGEPRTGHRRMTKPQQYVAREFEETIKRELGADAHNTVRAALPAWMRSQPEPQDWYERSGFLHK